MWPFPCPRWCSTLRDKMQTSYLCNPQAFTHNLEDTYAQIWNKHCLQHSGTPQCAFRFIACTWRTHPQPCHRCRGCRQPSRAVRQGGNCGGEESKTRPGYELYTLLTKVKSLLLYGADRLFLVAYRGQWHRTRHRHRGARGERKEPSQRVSSLSLPFLAGVVATKTRCVQE